MTTTIPVNCSAQTVLTKMHCSNQMEAVASTVNWVARSTVTFRTPWAQRKFKKNFYRWSMKLVEQRIDLTSEMAETEQNVLVGLEKIAPKLIALSSLLPEDRQPRLDTGKLEPEAMMVVLIDRECGRIIRTFQSFDRILIPTYAGFLAEKIPKSEFDRIKSQVEVIFETFKLSMDDLLNRPKTR